MQHNIFTSEIYLDCEGSEYTVTVTGLKEDDGVNVLSYEIATIHFSFEFICMKFSDYKPAEIEEKAERALIEAVNLHYQRQREQNY